MTTDDMEIVSAIKARLVDRVGWKRFELWFANGTRLVPLGDKLIVETSSTFYQDWLRKNFRRDLEAVLSQVLRGAASVEFRVDESLAPKTNRRDGAKRDPGESSVARSSSAGASSGRATLATPAASKDSGGTPRREYLSFDQFVAGRTNELALTSAQLVAGGADHVSPLLIHGPTGIGKTHLLEAIVGGVRRQNRRQRAVYLTAEQFTTYFLEALGGKGLPSFRRKYRGVDLLAIDDVQFFVGKRATLVELLYTFDTLLREGRQLVFAADGPPGKLKGLGSELVARLSGGLVCGIRPPDYETRCGITRQLAERMKLKISAEVASLVAGQLTSHAREISGALNRLHAVSRIENSPITRHLAEQALASLAAQTSRVVRLPDIERAVCETFGLQSESLKSERKAKAVTYPRMLAMFLARKHTRAALSEIGHFFGRRSHSTVISASKKVEGWMRDQTTLQLAEQTCNVEDTLRQLEDQLHAG